MKNQSMTSNFRYPNLIFSLLNRFANTYSLWGHRKPFIKHEQNIHTQTIPFLTWKLEALFASSAQRPRPQHKHVQKPQGHKIKNQKQKRKTPQAAVEGYNIVETSFQKTCLGWRRRSNLRLKRLYLDLDLDLQTRFKAIH